MESTSAKLKKSLFAAYYMTLGGILLGLLLVMLVPMWDGWAFHATT